MLNPTLLLVAALQRKLLPFKTKDFDITQGARVTPSLLFIVTANPKHTILVKYHLTSRVWS